MNLFWLYNPRLKAEFFGKNFTKYIENRNQKCKNV